MPSHRRKAVIACFNQKGGVGKTTTCLNITSALHRGGRTPIALDLDPQGHLGLASGSQTEIRGGMTQFFNEKTPLSQLIRTSPLGWSIVGTTLELAKAEAAMSGKPSTCGLLQTGILEDKLLHEGPILIDCCPTLGGLTLNALIAADRVLIPVVADFLSIQGVHRVNSLLNVLERNLKRRIERRIVLTRFDAKKPLSHYILKQLKELYGDVVCETKISDDAAVATSPMHGQDVFSFSMKSQGAIEYRALTIELGKSGFFEAPEPNSRAAPAETIQTT